MSAPRRVGALVIAATALLGCSSGDSAGPTTSPAPATTVVSSSIPPTSTTHAPTTTAAPTTTRAPIATEAPTTTAPATAAPPASTVMPSEWRAVDPRSVGLPMAKPCCGTNWVGDPSPGLPGAGVALSDGVYAVDGLWPVDPTQPMPLRVMRLVPCAVDTAVVACEGAGPYPDDALGIDRSQFRTVSVALDADLSVIYSGFETDASGQFLAATSVGDGTNLAQLALAVDGAYERRIAARVRAGEEVDAVFDDVAANPGDGLSAAPPAAGRLIFDDGNAPPVLFQAPVDRGADALGTVVLRVADSKLTLVIYAGFIS